MVLLERSPVAGDSLLLVVVCDGLPASPSPGNLKRHREIAWQYGTCVMPELSYCSFEVALHFHPYSIDVSFYFDILGSPYIQC